MPKLSDSWQEPSSRMGADKAMQVFEDAYKRVFWELEHEDDPVMKTKVAGILSTRCRGWQSAFGEHRTVGLWSCRDDLDMSLADMAEEFGITRARAAQLLYREEYREKAKEQLQQERKALRATKGAKR